MKDKRYLYLVISLLIVLIASVISLFAGTFLAANFDVIGIRIAMLIVAFASFGSSTLFSLLVYLNNRTVSRINDDQNKRAELYRDLQFASSNYSIIEFTDRMLIQKESDRYLHKFHQKDTPSFHMVISDIDLEKPLSFYTIRIPFKVIEGKTAGSIYISIIRFEKDLVKYDFQPMAHEHETQSYMLYNETTQRKNLIVNLVFNTGSSYFNEEALNPYTKIKIQMEVTSILGVSIAGLSELYFTNPTQVEGNGLHTYKINSSNFTLNKTPFIRHKNQ